MRRATRAVRSRAAPRLRRRREAGPRPRAPQSCRASWQHEATIIGRRQGLGRRDRGHGVPPAGTVAIARPSLLLASLQIAFREGRPKRRRGLRSAEVARARHERARTAWRSVIHSLTPVPLPRAQGGFTSVLTTGSPRHAQSKPPPRALSTRPVPFSRFAIDRKRGDDEVSAHRHRGETLSVRGYPLVTRGPRFETISSTNEARARRQAARCCLL